MRTVDVGVIREVIESLAIETNYKLSEDMCQKISEYKSIEENQGAKSILEDIEENISIAEKENIPLCQDTGLVCVFLEIGQEIFFTGGNLYQAINEGVRRGYEKGYLRKSVVIDPINRKNTGDNTPANIHVDIVPGNKIKLDFSPKGFGSENMSQIKMLAPAEGADGVKDFIVKVVKESGGNPCPPIVVGVGIGGTFDYAPVMAKKALMLPANYKNQDLYYREMEEEVLKRINNLGIGPQGFGGNTTALSVNIIKAPTHIAGLPVAVNIGCHVNRHARVII